MITCKFWQRFWESLGWMFKLASLDYKMVGYVMRARLQLSNYGTTSADWQQRRTTHNGIKTLMGELHSYLGITA